MSHEAVVTGSTPAESTESATSSGFAYFQGRYLPVEQANINIMTHAFLYGTAVFEGIRGYLSRASERQLFVFRLDEHFDRLRRSAKVLKMDLPADTGGLVEITRRLVRESGYHCDVYIRALQYKSARRIGVQLTGPDDFALFVLPMGEKFHGASAGSGIHVGVTSWRRVEDNAIPSRAKINGSYVNLALCADEIRTNGFDEALVLNEDGHLSEGAGMNVFLVRKGVLITSGVNDNILEGITRDSIQQIARAELGLETVVRSVDRSELYSADEMFLCGTAAEVVPVASVDRRMIGDGQAGPITRELTRLYSTIARGEMPAYADWLCPVH